MRPKPSTVRSLPLPSDETAERTVTGRGRLASRLAVDARVVESTTPTARPLTYMDGARCDGCDGQIEPVW